MGLIINLKIYYNILEREFEKKTSSGTLILKWVLHLIALNIILWDTGIMFIYVNNSILSLVNWNE